MADSAASPPARLRRVTSRKRRQAIVPTRTENTAARTAQPLAQLSDAARDGSTLDLFPDDPTRAALQAMSIDIRQGTLQGFELPDVVLAAVGAIGAIGAIGAAEGASPGAKRRRANRGETSDDAGYVNAVLNGFESEPEMPPDPLAHESTCGEVRQIMQGSAAADGKSDRSAAELRDGSRDGDSDARGEGVAPAGSTCGE